MAHGHWILLAKGPATICFNCGDLLQPGDDAYETELGTYCCEACADDAEAHDEGLVSRCDFDGSYPD